MKKIAYLASLSALLLIGSCSKDTTTDMVTGYAPTVQATIGQFTSANPKLSPMAGVIEDNPSYTAGEQFYWHNGDKIKMLFYPIGDTISPPKELIYTAVVPDGTKPNTCSFTASGSIPVGNYSACALYPADSWTRSDFRYQATSSPMIVVEDVSSTYLKDHLLMKAIAGNVTVTAEGTSPINLSFKHLTSVVRFHITSDYNTTSMTTSGPLRLAEKNGSHFFYTTAYLNSINSMELVPSPYTWTSHLTVIPLYEFPFTKKGNTREFDFYMPVLPTAISTTDMSLKIEADIKINNNNIVQQAFGTYNGLSFTNELSFMPNGFEAGKSYYFNLKAEFY